MKLKPFISDPTYMSFTHHYISKHSSAQGKPVFNKDDYDEIQGFHVLGIADKYRFSNDNGFSYMVGKIEKIRRLTTDICDPAGELIKIDTSGMIEWSHILNIPDNYGEINDVISNPDSTIVTAGFVHPADQGHY